MALAIVAAKVVTAVLVVAAEVLMVLQPAELDIIMDLLEAVVEAASGHRHLVATAANIPVAAVAAVHTTMLLIRVVKVDPE